MARNPRGKPTSSGPGSGTPHSRTAARPGERAAGQRTRTRAAEPQPEALDAADPVVAPLRQVGNRALGATWRFLLLIVVVAVIAVTLTQSLRIYFAQADEIATLRLEIKAGHDEIADLQDKIERWEDPRFVRAEARQRLGWVMPGETGYRVIGRDGEPIGGDADALALPADAGGAWFERLWGSVVAADQVLPEPETTQPDPDITIGPEPSEDDDE